MANYKRCFPLEGDFMSYNIKDLLYGYLQYKATFDTTTKQLYIDAKKYRDIKPELANLYGCSIRTVEREIEKLINCNLLTRENDRFIITATASKYQLIDYDMLEYLLETRNHNTIRIYVYLLNKYIWKKSIDAKYTFTITELLEVIGYKTVSADKTNAIRRIIDSLEREGIIKTSIIIMPICKGNKTIPVQRYVLDYVAEHENEIKKPARKIIHAGKEVYLPEPLKVIPTYQGFVF